MNVKEAIPFFAIASMEASLRFYVDGLGFTMTNHWIDEGKLRWCMLRLGGAAIMLQEFETKRTVGDGVTICFLCNDALAIYHDAIAKGLDAERPFVGNNMWVTSLSDPDGYRLVFESATDVPEETVYEGNADVSPAE